VGRAQAAGRAPAGDHQAHAGSADAGASRVRPMYVSMSSLLRVQPLLDPRPHREGSLTRSRVGSVEADANRGAHRGRKRAALRGSHGVLPTSFRKAPQIQVRPSVRPISLRSPTPLPSNNWLEKSSNSVFFSVCSSAYFPKKSSSLDEAEEAMFALYAERAQLQDGQSVLDVGCGWGSLSMYIAEKYPNSTVTGVSNSDTQKAFIAEECR
jgi:hypothetical protein